MLLQVCVKTEPNKVAGGVLPDIVHRLYQDILCILSTGIHFHGTHLNVISFKPIRKEWASLQKVSWNFQCSTALCSDFVYWI